jgi:DNA-binding response OmpR family regulator
MPAPAAVLIAEDEPDIRQILHALLEEEGYTVLSAADGQDALELATTQYIGLILLDLQMPLLNGEAFCRAYRERGGTAPVVLLTAAAPAIVEAATVVCGAIGSISKPFDLDHVVETVALHLTASA